MLEYDFSVFYFEYCDLVQLHPGLAFESDIAIAALKNFPPTTGLAAKLAVQRLDHFPAGFGFRPYGIHAFGHSRNALCRILRSQQFLSEKKSNVREIAAQVGYQSEAAFCRIFKSKVGETPASYRRKILA